MIERLEELYLFEEIVKIQYVEQMKTAADHQVSGCALSVMLRYILKIKEKNSIMRVFHFAVCYRPCGK